MLEISTYLFSTGPFIPHGHCYLWKPGLVWLHLASDALIALAYYSIPMTLFYFVRKRQDLPYDWMFMLFAAFIVACGTTHLMGIWTLWHPTYWVSGGIKAITAGVSVFTAIQLVPLVPQALALKSPAQLEKVNQALQAEIAERLRFEEELRKYQNNLEELVQERTREIAETNAQLQQEIAERQRTEIALRQSRQTAKQQLAELEAIYTTAPVGLCFHDPDYRFVRINERLAQMNGLSVAEHTGLTLREVLPDLANTVEPLLQQVIESKSPILNHEIHGSTPAQPSINRDWLANYYPLLGNDDTVLGVNVVVEEITERKRAEAALRESELNFRTLADTMPQMFWTTRPDGYHEYFNQRWYEYTGMTWEETQGWGWNHILHPDDQQRCLEIWQESLRTGCDYNIEYRLRRASDGEYRWFLGRAFPLRDEVGNILKWFGSCTDIHDQRTALEERDRALERERLARATAETANRLKDEFLAVLSHELRSPLNPILGWTKLLQNRQLDAKLTHEALSTIERNAKLQMRLIEDLLDISRIMRGKLSLQVDSVNLEATISAALETVRLAAEAKSIEIHKSFPPLVVLVAGDASRLQQIIWNLLSNAVKFTPPGGWVEVQLKQTDNYAQIIVSDNGNGIKPEFLPHVFDYFRQADSSITRAFGGLGLGLAIVYHLVELHGGTIKAESPGEGKGATFTVTLPLLEHPREVVPQDEEQSSSSIPSESLFLGGIQILLVDDDLDTQSVMKMALQQEGAEVTVVSSAKLALEILQLSHPHVLVSDIGMPEMDGYSLIRQVRKLSAQQGGQIPAIALTAYATEADQQQALAAGFNLHLAKPVAPDKLVMSILKVLSL
jgi:PAS domain S-box-containing protein